jgi:hypothetical protein
VPNLVQLHFEVTEGQTVQFNVEGAQTAPACFALGVRKSGSSLFSNLVAAIAMHNNRQVVDIPGTFFQLGHRYRDWNEHARISNLVWPGNVYVGFRDPPSGLYSDPVFQQARKILLVRDPRDALVSEYFSNAYSHSIPEKGDETSVVVVERARALNSQLSDYVVSRAKALDATVAGYKAILGDPNTLVIRYEDVILSKADWIGSIAKHFNMTAPNTLVQDMLKWADVVPDEENPRAFVRQVKPGNFRAKLDENTISEIEKSLSPIWKDLGYELGSGE